MHHSFYKVTILLVNQLKIFCTCISIDDPKFQGYYEQYVQPVKFSNYFASLVRLTVQSGGRLCWGRTWAGRNSALGPRPGLRGDEGGGRWWRGYARAHHCSPGHPPGWKLCLEDLWGMSIQSTWRRRYVTLIPVLSAFVFVAVPLVSCNRKHINSNDALRSSEFVWNFLRTFRSPLSFKRVYVVKAKLNINVRRPLHFFALLSFFLHLGI